LVLDSFRLGVGTKFPNADPDTFPKLSRRAVVAKKRSYPLKLESV